jgi:lipoprotein-releasing system permease protein
MISAYERLIIGRYLTPRKGEGFIFVTAILSVLAMLLAVAGPVIVMSVMNGFRADLLDRILGVNGHALVQGYDGKLENWRDILVQARQTPGVVKAEPIIEQPLMASRQNRSAGAIVRGVLPADLGRNPLVADNVLEGNLAEFKAGEPVVALGARLAETLLARPGDTITLISPNGQVTPFGTTPRIAAYRVVAVFEVGIFDYDNAFVFMPLDTAQTFFRMGDAVGAVEMVTRNADEVGDIVAPLQAAASKVGVLIDWRSVNRALFEALEVERAAMFSILSVLSVMAAFLVLSCLFMLVRAQNRDIAILRTMGAGRGSILKLFMLLGLWLSLIGIGLGLLLSWLVLTFRTQILAGVSKLTGFDIWNPSVRFLSEMPSKTDPGDVITTVVICLVLTLICTFYPAWKAANTDPVKVLRYD